VKMDLTNYFAEMEYFHVMLSEIVDEALEHIVETVQALQRTFLKYADLQRQMLRTWNFKPEESCNNRYMHFLLHWSDKIFKCSVGSELNVAYDTFAITELVIKYIMRELEFRIQRLYNCFLFGDYRIRCRFLQNPSKDFSKLFSKLEELQTYYDIKIRGGRILANRQYFPQRRRRSKIDVETVHINFQMDNDENDINDTKIELKPIYNNNNYNNNIDSCLPSNFPYEPIINSNLKNCFYFPELQIH